MPKSFFGSQGADQAAAGFGAGIVATFTMQPFDILKVRFQVATKSESVGYGRAIYTALRNVVHKEGPAGLWRGIVPNIIGNSGGWATYFYFYTIFKDTVQTRQHNTALSPSQYLLCASTAGSISAMVTNPFYVIKTRMYTSSYNNSSAYKGLFDGMNKIIASEGVLGLWKGTLLALGTVANSALQFTIYEEMKKARFAARHSQPGVNDKLPNWEYTALSGSSKLLALATTYPYQVIRSRLQNSTEFENIRHCVKESYRREGVRAFYRGLGINAIRILPGTCVTFVTYENLIWIIKEASRDDE
ncbi:hypothetical protein E3P99_01244 [Wallemia hederae]|uniref:Mitochondrial carrier n=1 Tax=Wallemia hederae TaxID=1540922 RepID=A0A4T0FVS5_9BASI|nr:hypothetical protein E3P99_01244 [Wallemia hederae]